MNQLFTTLEFLGRGGELVIFWQPFPGLPEASQPGGWRNCWKPCYINHRFCQHCAASSMSCRIKAVLVYNRTTHHALRLVNRWIQRTKPMSPFLAKDLADSPSNSQAKTGGTWDAGIEDPTGKPLIFTRNNGVGTNGFKASCFVWVVLWYISFWVWFRSKWFAGTSFHRNLWMRQDWWGNWLGLERESMYTLQISPGSIAIRLCNQVTKLMQCSYRFVCMARASSHQCTFLQWQISPPHEPKTPWILIHFGHS